MRKSFFILFLLISMTSFKVADNGFQTSGIDRSEALIMFDYLQELRQMKGPKSDPLSKYVKEKRAILYWNDTLSLVAEARAMDMAKHNYFDHVDKKGRAVNYYIAEAGYPLEKEWTENKKDNFFESIQAGAADGRAAIYDLIIDAGVPGKGHRKHLLGLDDWNEKNVDVGIAFYRCSTEDHSFYASYTVIIIARHHW
jgi:hypothetical protein